MDGAFDCDHCALPQIADPNLSNTVKNRIRNIAAFLAGLQNPDGSCGIQADPDFPVTRTAQPGSDLTN